MRLETKQLAWIVLQAANHTQAKGSTVRLIIPRAPEVAHEMGIEPSDIRMMAVEEFLLEQGYVASLELGLSRGSYTITPKGLRWLDEGRVPLLLEVLETVSREEPEWPLGIAPANGASQEGTQAPWWRRVFGR